MGPPNGRRVANPFLQQPRPAVGTYVRRGQLDCCDGLQGKGSVVAAAGVQSALLADVGAAGRLRVAPCAAPCKCPMLDHGSFRIFGPVQAKASLTKEVTIYRVDGET